MKPTKEDIGQIEEICSTKAFIIQSDFRVVEHEAPQSFLNVLYTLRKGMMHYQFAWYMDISPSSKDKHAIPPMRIYYGYDPNTQILHILRREREEEETKSA